MSMGNEIRMKSLIPVGRSAGQKTAACHDAPPFGAGVLSGLLDFGR
jgi:hypothetical protein